MLAILTGIGELLKGKDGGVKHAKLKKCELQARERFATLAAINTPVAVNSPKEKSELQAMAKYAVNLFSTHRIHDMCLEWCKVALSLYTSEKDKGEKMYAEMLSAFSLSLCKTSSEESHVLNAREKAREAVDLWPKSHHFLAVWFECSKHAEFGGLIDVGQIKDEFDAIFKACVDGGMRAKDMLAALSMMSYSCKDLQGTTTSTQSGKITDRIGTGKTISQTHLLIFVLSTWIKTLGNPKSTLRDVVAAQRKPTKVSTSSGSPPGNDLLSLVKAFLREVEKAICTGGVCFEEVKGDVYEILQVPLSILTKIRSRTEDELKTDCSIFDDPVTRSKVGTQDSCTWIAEQCWNLGVRAMSKNETATASELFARAHDFGLLSYEEEGQRHTEGFLDYEQRVTQQQHRGSKGADIDDATVHPCCLSSEFSFQCLLLSVTTGLDGIAELAPPSVSLDSFVEKSMKEEILGTVSRRINQCRQELETCNDAIIKENSPFVAYLSLRSAVEAGNQELGLSALDDIETGKELHEFITGVGRQELLKGCASRAEEKGMNELAKRLWGISAEMVLKVARDSHKRKDRDDNHDEYQEYGRANRKIIKLCGGVAQEVLTFERIAETVCTFGGTGTWEEKKEAEEGKDRVRVQDLFHQEDLDWFVVESYSRGISLSYFGDTKNAEVLLRTSLNLLPFADKEVATWGDTIRHGYSIAAENAEGGWGGAGVAGVEGSTMHLLFKGVTPG